MKDRRLWFFLGAAAACGLLVPVTASELRWVPQALVVIYVVLSALVALEVFGHRSDDDAPSPPRSDQVDR